MFDIRNLIQNEDQGGNVEFLFTLSNFPFSILVDYPDDDSTVYRLRSVYHEIDKKCPFCKKNRVLQNCEVLHEHIEILFEQILSKNEVRLQWLFREYEKI